MCSVGNDGDELIECVRLVGLRVVWWQPLFFLLRNICTSETIVKDCKSSPR